MATETVINKRGLVAIFFQFNTVNFCRLPGQHCSHFPVTVSFLFVCPVFQDLMCKSFFILIALCQLSLLCCGPFSGFRSCHSIFLSWGLPAMEVKTVSMIN